MVFNLFVFAECRSAKCYSNECRSATAVNYERKPFTKRATGVLTPQLSLENVVEKL
jgi:hypothetical protein